MKERGLTGVSSAKTFDITTMQEAAIKTKVDAILLSNSETLKKLLGEQASLDNYRGTRINYSIPIIVTNPFAHIHTIEYGRWLLEKDLDKFKRIKEPIQVFDFILVNSEELRREALHFLKSCLIISFDIETDNKRQITCISFTGLSTTKRVLSFVVPLVDFDHIHYQDADEFQDALLFIQEVLALSTAKLAFNGMYDSQYCITYHAWPENYTLDAMILNWSRYSELPRSLEFNASIHCYDYFFWKDEADEAKKKKDIRSYWAYCAKDSWYTLRVLLSQLSDLQAYQVFNYQETFRLTYPDLYCAFEGIKINQEKLKEVRADRVKESEEKLRKLRIISCNPGFNPSSWQQVSQLVYDVIGGKKPEKFKGAGTSAPVLNRVATQHPLLATVCDLIISYREDIKAISTYCDFDQLFGRLLYNIDPSGAETGRPASKASNFWVGTQIQNIPPYAKHYLDADDGYDLVEADKNKSEARCVAYMARAPKMIEALEDSEHDFYKTCSTLFFGIPYEEVTEEMRSDITKHIIHGTHHLMGPDPFIDTVSPKKMYAAMILTKSPLRNMTAFAKYLLSLYHRMNPELKREMWPSVRAEITATHMSRSHLGWVRYFFGNPMKQHKVFREGVAHQSQNLSVHLINRAFWRIYTDLVVPSAGEFRLKAHIHDSIFVQIKTEKALEYAKRMKEIMHMPTKIHENTMIIPTDFKMGKTWGTMQKIKLV
jgi:DNA polymerase I-like protein with 3'-5' exonuclease and polymerase domains